LIKTIAKNVFSNYVGIAGTIIIAFLLSPFLVHSLGDTGYGIWSVVAALTGYMALLDLGVSSAIAKYVSRHKALDDYRSVNVVIASGLMIMIVVASGLVLLSPLIASSFVSFFSFEQEFADTVHKLILIASLDIGIFVSTGVLMGTFYGIQRYEVINAVNLLMALFKAILFYYFLTAGFGLVTMGFISLFGNIFAAFALFFSLKKFEPSIHIDVRNADRKTISNIFGYSKYTLLSMVALQLVYYSDAFVIGFFMSAAAITYYSIPWSLGEYTNKLILAIAQTFVPVFSEQEATQGNQAIYATYVTGTKVMLIVSNLLCLGVLAVGDYFVALWMGPTYAEKCSAVLSIIFLTQLIKGPQLLSYSILLGTSNHRIFSFYNFSFSILNLILSIILIQKYELVGVAIGTAITQILFYGVITPILTSRVIRSSLIRYFRDTYLRAIPSSILLFVVLKYLANNNAPDSYFELIGQALMAASLYAVVAYWTLLGSEERAYLSSTVSRFAARA
jgi:O-antigen/teichoic acid export membrane protein